MLVFLLKKSSYSVPRHHFVILTEISIVNTDLSNLYRIVLIISRAGYKKAIQCLGDRRTLVRMRIHKTISVEFKKKCCN